MICFHEIVLIDGSGKSCGRCGVALEGYGIASPFPGKQEVPQHCLHGKTAWRTINETQEQCIYCLLVCNRDEKPAQPASWPAFKMIRISSENQRR